MMASLLVFMCLLLSHYGEVVNDADEIVFVVNYK